MEPGLKSQGCSRAAGWHSKKRCKMFSGLRRQRKQSEELAGCREQEKVQRAVMQRGLTFEVF